MTLEKQRIAIAEACGWKLSPPNLEYKWLNPNTKWSEPELPDYLNDLNAMHEVENTLSKEQLLIYSEQIYYTASKCEKETGLWRYLSASAAQRAEAFLRTIGKWEDDK